jgi:hypothetical protein
VKDDLLDEHPPHKNPKMNDLTVLVTGVGATTGISVVKGSGCGKFLPAQNGAFLESFYSMFHDVHFAVFRGESQSTNCA